MHSDLEQSYRHCESLARRSGSTFFLAFRLLPREMYREMCVLYAFMRQTDDLGDDSQLPVEFRRDLLQQWRRELDLALSGEYCPSRLLPALADVAWRRDIPAEYLHEVIRGVQSDLSPRTFQSFAELEGYCYQVAGVVGLSCLRIWGYRGDEPRTAALACGTAFQLTNILRDLAEDAAQGRIYLPRNDLKAFDYSPADLKARRNNAAFQALMRFEVGRAWSFYDQALPLRHALSPAGRRIFLTFFELYGSLLQQIEAAQYDVFTRRIRLPSWKKLSVAMRCWWPRGTNRVPLMPRSTSTLAETSPR